MEISAELQQSITKANQAVENAQSGYENMLARVIALKAEYAKAFIHKNPTASLVDTDQYLKTALKIDYEIFQACSDKRARAAKAAKYIIAD